MAKEVTVVIEVARVSAEASQGSHSSSEWWWLREQRRKVEAHEMASQAGT